MSDTVLIVLIIAAAIVIVLFALRKRVQRFFLRKDDQAFETGLEAASSQPPPPPQAGVRISRNWMFGKKQSIVANQPKAEVKRNVLAGTEQDIKVQRDSKRDQGKP